MKAQSRFSTGLLAALLCGLAVSASAQPLVGGAGGPKFSGGMAKLFGENSAFTAKLEIQTKGSAPEEAVTVLGNLAYADSKSRLEMDMANIKGGGMPPEAATHMKSMGMDKMVMISRPDKKLTYLAYPGLKAYAEMAAQDQDAGKPASDFKLELTELGKETVDGHPCVKNKAVVTDSNGKKHEATTWNATDLKKFPVKIEQTEEGKPVTLLFKEVKLSKPPATSFDPPADYKKYDSIQTMMQEVMMKQMGGGMGGHPPIRPPQQP